MSATTGRIERRTTSLRASPARLSGTATRAISQPPSWSCSIWRMVASTSCVSVVHIDCTATGAPSPIAVPPTQTRLDFRRGRGEARSSGRFKSTLIRVSIDYKSKSLQRRERDSEQLFNSCERIHHGVEGRHTRPEEEWSYVSFVLFADFRRESAFGEERCTVAA